MTASLEHKQRMLAHLGGTVGTLPWRVVDRHQNFGRCVDVQDAHGNVLDFTLPRVAKMAASAVNERNKLFGDNVAYADALRALQAQLVPIRAMPAVKRALELIEATLHPEKF